MTLQELIELAILDAMGLLDDDERELFECAFRAAAPAIQAQVRREQTRLSQIEMLLPDVIPPAGLRALVIQRVRDEMARATASPSRDLVVPALVPSRGVSPLWRAASVGLLAAVLVLAVTMFLFQNQQRHLLQQIEEGAIHQALVDEFGMPFVMEVLFGRDTQRIQLVADDPTTFRGHATVVVNPEWPAARFFCKDLVEMEKGYRLAIIDDNGRVVDVLATIRSDGRLENKTVPLNFNASGTIALIAPDNDIVSRAKLQG